MEKIPCIKCNSLLWEYIKPYLEKWGYNTTLRVLKMWEQFPVLTINSGRTLGICEDIPEEWVGNYNRYLVTNVEEFLEKAAELKGFIYKRKDMKKEFTKSDLKPGMVVEYANRERRLVLEINGKIFFTEKGIQNPNNIQSGYSDTLINKYPDLTINKVFKINYVDTIDKIFNDKCLKLIWERPKEILEVTLEEIAAKFGVPEIKIKQNK